MRRTPYMSCNSDINSPSLAHGLAPYPYSPVRTLNAPSSFATTFATTDSVGTGHELFRPSHAFNTDEPDQQGTWCTTHGHLGLRTYTEFGVVPLDFRILPRPVHGPFSIFSHAISAFALRLVVRLLLLVP